MRIDGKDGLMKKIYTGKSLDELKALAISEIKELGVDEADSKKLKNPAGRKQK